MGWSAYAKDKTYQSYWAKNAAWKIIGFNEVRVTKRFDNLRAAFQKHNFPPEREFSTWMKVASPVLPVSYSRWLQETKETRGQDCVYRSWAAGHRRVLWQRCRHVQHVAAAMTFRCKGKCHELCFETDCKRTVVGWNLVGYTVVLMSKDEEDINIHQRQDGYSVTNESNDGTILVQLTIQASLHVTAVLIEKLCKLLSLPWRAILPDVYGKSAHFPFFWK